MFLSIGKQTGKLDGIPSDRDDKFMRNLSPRGDEKPRSSNLNYFRLRERGFLILY